MQVVSHSSNQKIVTNLTEQLDWLTNYIITEQNLIIPNGNQYSSGNQYDNNNNAKYNANTTLIPCNPDHNHHRTTQNGKNNNNNKLSVDELIDLTAAFENDASVQPVSYNVSVNFNTDTNTLIGDTSMNNPSIDELQLLYDDICTQHIETLNELITIDKSDPQYNIMKQNVSDIDHKRNKIKSKLDQLRQSLTPNKSMNNIPPLEQSDTPYQKYNNLNAPFNNAADGIVDMSTDYNIVNQTNTITTNRNNVPVPAYMTDTINTNQSKSAIPQNYNTPNQSVNRNHHSAPFNTNNYNNTTSNNIITSSAISDPSRTSNFTPPPYTGHQKLNSSTVTIKTTRFSAEPDVSKWSSTKFPWNNQLFQLNKQIFGNSSFRKHQREVINTAMSGTDVLVLMPTGGGTWIQCI